MAAVFIAMTTACTQQTAHRRQLRRRAGLGVGRRRRGRQLAPWRQQQPDRPQATQLQSSGDAGYNLAYGIAEISLTLKN
jgi:hypothetical protein